MATRTASTAPAPLATLSEARPPTPVFLPAAEVAVLQSLDRVLDVLEHVIDLEEMLPPACGWGEPSFDLITQEIATGWARLATASEWLARRVRVLPDDGSDAAWTRSQVLTRLVGRLVVLTLSAGDPEAGFGQFERGVLLDLFSTGGRRSQVPVADRLDRTMALFARLEERRRLQDEALSALVVRGAPQPGVAPAPVIPGV